MFNQFKAATVPGSHIYTHDLVHITTDIPP